MGRRVLFYALIRQAPNTPTGKWEDAYVVAHYSNGDVRYWYPEDVGYKSARVKALAPAYGRKEI